jgi:hypothetical protein
MWHIRNYVHYFLHANKMMKFFFHNTAKVAGFVTFLYRMVSRYIATKTSLHNFVSNSIYIRYIKRYIIVTTLQRYIISIQRYSANTVKFSFLARDRERTVPSPCIFLTYTKMIVMKI